MNDSLFEEFNFVTYQFKKLKNELYRFDYLDLGDKIYSSPKLLKAYRKYQLAKQFKEKKY